ncbi:hypothetical protein D3C75_1095390 [compost metagenome]
MVAAAVLPPAPASVLASVKEATVTPAGAALTSSSVISSNQALPLFRLPYPPKRAATLISFCLSPVLPYSSTYKNSPPVSRRSADISMEPSTDRLAPLAPLTAPSALIQPESLYRVFGFTSTFCTHLASFSLVLSI